MNIIILYNTSYEAVDVLYNTLCLSKNNKKSKQNLKLEESPQVILIVLKEFPSYRVDKGKNEGGTEKF